MRKPTLTAELIAEFLGTFVLMLFGMGVVAMVVLFPSNIPGATVHGGYTNITLGWDWPSPWASTFPEKFLADISTPPSPSP